MTIDELAAAVFARGGELRAVNGRIRYAGPPLAPDDAIRTAVVEHRAALLAIAAEHERGRQARDRAADAEEVAA